MQYHIKITPWSISVLACFQKFWNPISIQGMMKPEGIPFFSQKPCGKNIRKSQWIKMMMINLSRKSVNWKLRMGSAGSFLIQAHIVAEKKSLTLLYFLTMVRRGERYAMTLLLTFLCFPQSLFPQASTVDRDNFLGVFLVTSRQISSPFCQATFLHSCCPRNYCCLEEPVDGGSYGKVQGKIWAHYLFPPPLQISVSCDDHS